MMHGWQFITDDTQNINVIYLNKMSELHKWYLIFHFHTQIVPDFYFIVVFSTYKSHFWYLITFSPQNTL